MIDDTIFSYVLILPVLPFTLHLTPFSSLHSLILTPFFPSLFHLITPFPFLTSTPPPLSFLHSSSSPLSPSLPLLLLPYPFPLYSLYSSSLSLSPFFPQLLLLTPFSFFSPLLPPLIIPPYFPHLFLWLLQSFSWVLAEIAPYDHRHIIKGIMKEERRVGEE